MDGAAHAASGRGQNVLVHAEEVCGIQPGFQCRQACIVGPIGGAYRLWVFPGTEGIHIHGATTPGAERLPTRARPLYMPHVFGGFVPLS